LQQAITQAMAGGRAPQQQGMVQQGAPQAPMRPGVTGAEVMAAPGVQAAPGPPPAPTLGRQVRPAGIATGMAPGVKRQGME